MHMYICTYTHTHIYINSIYIYTHICTCIHMHTHTYTYICTCTVLNFPQAVGTSVGLASSLRLKSESGGSWAEVGGAARWWGPAGEAPELTGFRVWTHQGGVGVKVKEAEEVILALSWRSWWLWWRWGFLQSACPFTALTYGPQLEKPIPLRSSRSRREKLPCLPLFPE